MPRIQPVNTEMVSDDIKVAFQHHVTTYAGSRITNMKATLGHSLLAFEVYMQWYPLYEEVNKILGERLAYLFAHAISEGSNCPLCSTFFRKIIIQNGENPDALELSEFEQQVLDFGTSMSNRKGEINASIYQAVSTQFNDHDMVVLVAFAGQMIATNIFNNALEVDVDEYLFPFRSAILQNNTQHG
jgi:hypothetical protein